MADRLQKRSQSKSRPAFFFLRENPTVNCLGKNLVHNLLCNVLDNPLGTRSSYGSLEAPTWLLWNLCFNVLIAYPTPFQTSAQDPIQNPKLRQGDRSEMRLRLPGTPQSVWSDWWLHAPMIPTEQVVWIFEYPTTKDPASKAKTQEPKRKSEKNVSQRWPRAKDHMFDQHLLSCVSSERHAFGMDSRKSRSCSGCLFSTVSKQN